MPPFRDLGDVAAHLSALNLPFRWFVMGPEDHAIKFEVAPGDTTAATEYFAQHPLTLSDGTAVGVVVQQRRGESWTIQPPRGNVTGRDEQFDSQQLVGLRCRRSSHPSEFSRMAGPDP